MSTVNVPEWSLEEYKLFVNFYRAMVNDERWTPLDEQWRAGHLSGKEYVAQRSIAYEAVALATKYLDGKVAPPVLFQRVVGTMHAFEMKEGLAATDRLVVRLGRKCEGMALR